MRTENINKHRYIYIYILATILFCLLGVARIDAYAIGYVSESTLTDEWHSTYNLLDHYDDYGNRVDPWAAKIWETPGIYDKHGVTINYNVKQTSYTGSYSVTKGVNYGYDSYTFIVNNLDITGLDDAYRRREWVAFVDVEATDGKHYGVTADTDYYDGDVSKSNEYRLVTGSLGNMYANEKMIYDFDLGIQTIYDGNFIRGSKASGTVRITDIGRIPVKKITLYLGKVTYRGHSYGGGYGSGFSDVIYAKMGEIYKGFNIIFNVNGGSISLSNQVALDITLPNPGTRAGYTFDGWYNGDTRIGGIGDKWKPTANATLTAKWTPIIYTIRYNTYEGNLSKEKTVTYTVESPTITLENPTLDGKEFLGWSDWNDGTPKKPYTIPKGTIGDLIISANWGVPKNNGSDSGAGGAGSGSDTNTNTDNSNTSHIFTGQSYVKSNRFKISA